MYYLIFFMIIAIFKVFKPLLFIDPMNIYFETNNLNIDNIRNNVIKDMNYKQQQQENDKHKFILEKEKIIKNELEKIIEQNIIKQIEIENENKKYIKYYDIVKKNSRKEIDDYSDENIIEFVENKLNSNNKNKKY